MRHYLGLIISVAVLSLVFVYSSPVGAEEAQDLAVSAEAQGASGDDPAEPGEVEPLTEDLLGALAGDIKSVDLGGEKCDEPSGIPECPEPKPCPACPPTPKCPPPPKCDAPVLLESNAALLAPARQAMASANLGVLRDEVLSLKKAKRVDDDYVDHLINEIDLYMEMYRELPHSGEALYLKAELYGLTRSYEGRLVTLSKLLFEYPHGGDFTEKAVIGIRGLFTGKLKKALKYDKGLSKGSEKAVWSDRYAQVLGLLHEFGEDKYRPYLMAEYDEFLSRYPRHKFAEQVLRYKAEGLVSMKQYESAAFTLSWLARLYPESKARCAALYDLALLYDERQKDYAQAVRTLEALVGDYPDGKETLDAYKRAAVLYDKKLKDAAGALRSLEAIVSKYPGDKAALDAFLYIAKLYDSGKQYAESVDALNRLATMFKGSDDAVTALKEAAKTASGRLKDYELQIKSLRRIVDEYSEREEAILALNSIAETTNKQLGKTAEAINVYKSLIKQYPDHKLAESARKMVDKLLNK